MEVTFQCFKGHSSESEIEEMISETKSHHIVSCRCSYCGRINRVKVRKDFFPSQKTDVNKQTSSFKK